MQKIISSYVLVFLFFLTGCMGSSDEIPVIYNLPFVVRYDAEYGKYLLQSVDFRLYSSAIDSSSSVKDGVCGKGNFAIDFDNTGTGYYDARVGNWEILPLSSFTMEANKGATIIDSVVSLEKYALIDGFLFFNGKQIITRGEYQYNLNYDSLNEPEKGIYQLDFNVTHLSGADTVLPHTGQFVKVFDLDPFVQSFGIAKGIDTLKFNVGYCTGIGDSLLPVYKNVSSSLQIILDQYKRNN
ncbi:MAG: hypothetical protein PUB21_01030 [Bacteroidales bacterium]|nr:hypothetical protein [Bacteroidales bacterium]